MKLRNGENQYRAFERPYNVFLSQTEAHPLGPYSLLCVQGLGFKVWNLGLRVEDSGFRVLS